MHWPTSLFDLDKEKNKRKQNTTNQKKLNFPNKQSTEGQAQIEDEDEEDDELRKVHHKLRDLITNSISDKIGPFYSCDGIKNIYDNGSCFNIAFRGYRECPYDLNKQRHKSNHVFFNVLLDYPTPIIFIKCLDGDCIAANPIMAEKLEITKYIDEIKQTMTELIEKTIF